MDGGPEQPREAGMGFRFPSCIDLHGHRCAGACGVVVQRLGVQRAKFDAALPRKTLPVLPKFWNRVLGRSMAVGDELHRRRCVLA